MNKKTKTFVLAVIFIVVGTAVSGGVFLLATNGATRSGFVLTVMYSIVTSLSSVILSLMAAKTVIGMDREETVPMRGYKVESYKHIYDEVFYISEIVYVLVSLIYISIITMLKTEEVLSLEFVAKFAVLYSVSVIMGIAIINMIKERSNENKKNKCKKT